MVTERAPTIAGLLAGSTVQGVQHLADDISRTLARRRRPSSRDESPDQEARANNAGGSPGATPAAAPGASKSASAVGRRPALGSVNFGMEAGTLNIAALDLIRDEDTIALQHLFNDAI